MSGGLSHHTDEENGPSHTVGHELSKQQGCYSLERNQCVCADVIRVPANEKNKPTPLDMTDVVRDVVKGTKAVISTNFSTYGERTFNTFTNRISLLKFHEKSISTATRSIVNHRIPSE